MGLESIHFGLKCLGWFGILAVAFSTIGLQVTTAKLDSFKSQKIDDLITGKNILIEKVGDYQKQLEEKQSQINLLSRKAQNAERGISKFYTFNGQCKSQQGNRSTNIIGDETSIFGKLCELHDAKKWEELSLMATSIIKNNHEWLTPFLLRGIAYANLGDFASAEQDLQYVVSRAGDDPEYQQAAQLIAQINEAKSSNVPPE